MRAVGLRELKNRLSEYVRRARSGEVILVTDRGEVIAELRRPGQHSADAALDPRLVEFSHRGLVRLGGPNASDLYPEMPRSLRSVTSAELLDAGRSDR
jgi:antitoxin (DNA-binding transcriptional repressor) of toxin-antitoxin stability system